MKLLKVITWRLLIVSSVTTIMRILVHRPAAAIGAYNFHENICEADCLKSLTRKGTRLLLHIHCLSDRFIHLFSRQRYQLQRKGPAIQAGTSLSGLCVEQWRQDAVTHTPPKLLQIRRTVVWYHYPRLQ